MSSCENKGPLRYFWSRFHFLLSQNKSCNEGITKFEEAAKLRRADIIKTAMGEEWQEDRCWWMSWAAWETLIVAGKRLSGFPFYVSFMSSVKYCMSITFNVFCVGICFYSLNFSLWIPYLFIGGRGIYVWKYLKRAKLYSIYTQKVWGCAFVSFMSS